MLTETAIGPNAVFPGFVADQDFVMKVLVPFLDFGQVVGEQPAVDSDPRDVEHVCTEDRVHARHTKEHGPDSALRHARASVPLRLRHVVRAYEEAALADEHRHTDHLSVEAWVSDS